MTNLKENTINLEKDFIKITPDFVEKVKGMVDSNLDSASIAPFLPFLEKYQDNGLLISNKKIKNDSIPNLAIIVNDKSNFEESVKTVTPSILKSGIVDERFMERVAWFGHFSKGADFSPTEDGAAKDISFIDQNDQRHNYCLHTVCDGDNLGLVVSVSRGSIDGLAK